MATSYEFGKKEIKDYLKSKFYGYESILDVGAGQGTYYELLKDYFYDIEAIEIFEPNIETYDLRNKYRVVYNKDIKDFKYRFYDIIIFGDVIEHLEIKEAQKVLEYAYYKCNEMIVAVPYMYEQDEVDGNVYEIHKQADLTKEKVLERYPMLEYLYGNEYYGYFKKREGYGKI